MSVYEISIRFAGYQDGQNTKRDPSKRQVRAIIEAAFLNAGWYISDAGVCIK